MAWTIEYARSIRKVIERLDTHHRHRIRNFLEHRLTALDDPRSLGKTLTGQLDGLWRYRVGPYRIVCRIEDQRMVVLVVRIGHRSNVYR